jgi:hypothetical protein
MRPDKSKDGLMSDSDPYTNTNTNTHANANTSYKSNRLRKHRLVLELFYW